MYLTHVLRALVQFALCKFSSSQSVSQFGSIGDKKKKKRDGGEGRRGGGTGGLQYARVVGAEDGGAAHDFVGDADVLRSCGWGF